MNPYKLLRSGLVRRWHSNPDLAHTGETNAQHQWTVASLLLSLHPAPTLDLVREALWHDVGEMECGDLPAPFKMARPDIAASHAEAEAEARAAICPVAELSGSDLDWLILADRLAAWLWMAERAPWLMFDDPAWGCDERMLLGVAERLGCGLPVEALIAVYRRRWPE